MFTLDDFGEAVEYRPRYTRTSEDNGEQFARNIRQQLALFNGNGDDVLSPTGKRVTPTFSIEGDKVRYGLKFGGAWVKLNGKETHFRVPKDTFAARLEWLAEQAAEGWFQMQLNEISANIRARLKPKQATVEG